MIEKFKDGETLADYRIKRRNARKAAKMDVQKQLRIRDGLGCSWPGCELWKRGYRVEAANIDHAGMGGDPSLSRMVTSNLIRICYPHHQGVCSLHSGDLKIVPLTSKGTDGPCEFFRRDPKAPNGWAMEGGEDDYTFKRRENLSAADDADETEA